MTNSLNEYAEIFAKLGLSELSVEEEGFKLTLKKKLQSQSSSLEAKEKSEPLEFPVKERKQQIVESTSTLEVKAPLLGIFFGEVNGKALLVGDKVKEGDVLCSIEAMKMMNEVVAPSDGVIKRIGAKEGDLVEYDQVLFEIA